jgi:lysophospholipase L1-like esterase
MRSTRVVSVATMAILLSLATVAGATQSGAAAVNYAALGDSYSAGVGAGNYTSESGSCYRSYNAYPYLWTNANAPDSFSFVACSGAKTTDVINNQLSVLNSSTTLVSITIGGNDAGFAGTMETCVLAGTDACLSSVASDENYATTTLPGQLDTVYRDIHAKAPNAHVVVIGYPHLYQVPGNCIFGISDTSRSAINGAADTLDSVIAKRAANAGFTYEDVRDLFAGHEICGDYDQWLHSTTWPIFESYHPTADGQSGAYLPAFSAGV